MNNEPLWKHIDDNTIHIIFNLRNRDVYFNKNEWVEYC